MDKVATQSLPPRGSPPLQSGGHIQKWPTSGQRGYVTPAVWGIPTASERAAESQVAAVTSGKSYFGGGHTTKRGFQSRGTTSKVAELGGMTKLWMCSPKESPKKIFAEMVCLRRKTPLKPPHEPFLKRGGFSKPPPPLPLSLQHMAGTLTICQRSVSASLPIWFAIIWVRAAQPVTQCWTVQSTVKKLPSADDAKHPSPACKSPFPQNLHLHGAPNPEDMAKYQVNEAEDPGQR